MKWLDLNNNAVSPSAIIAIRVEVIVNNKQTVIVISWEIADYNSEDFSTIIYCNLLLTKVLYSV